jgi:hypothetical protein
MRICRITIDLTYTDDAEGAPKSDRAVWNLLDRVLDPELGEYMSCMTGVRVRHVDLPDPPKGRGKLEAWFKQANEQITLLDVERFAVTRAIDTPVPMERVIKKTRKTR